MVCVHGNRIDDEEAGNDGEELDDMPEDLLDMSPEEQQKRLKMRALYYLSIGKYGMMCGDMLARHIHIEGYAFTISNTYTYIHSGTALVLLFSDPMVDVLSEIGERTVSI